MRELGGQVLGVSHDTAESHRAFAKSLTLGFPLVADPEKKISRAYGLWSLFGAGRVTFVMDRRRIIRAVYKSTFNVVGHVDQAILSLRAILADQGPPPPG
jgi:peroxiredoxin Q/BCP